MELGGGSARLLGRWTLPLIQIRGSKTLSSLSSIALPQVGEEFSCTTHARLWALLGMNPTARAARMFHRLGQVYHIHVPMSSVLASGAERDDRGGRRMRVLLAQDKKASCRHLSFPHPMCARGAFTAREHSLGLSRTSSLSMLAVAEVSLAKGASPRPCAI